MLEFKTIETLKPNTEILEMIKGYTYKVKTGAINIFYIPIYRL